MFPPPTDMTLEELIIESHEGALCQYNDYFLIKNNIIYTFNQVYIYVANHQNILQHFTTHKTLECGAAHKRATVTSD